jgi:uracil-DNA glycosylase
MWFEQMHIGWQEALANWRPWLTAMEVKLATEEALAPSAPLVMTAFQIDPKAVRVVLMGQDPYPTAGVAVGRAFAVRSDSRPLPASLRNILSELVTDTGVPQTPDPALSSWQEQGVLLLNRHLTTLQGQAGAHTNLGWDSFTLAAVQHLLGNEWPPVLLLWGSHAQKLLKELQPIDGKPAPVAVVSAHPSPLSAYRGFFGSKPFSAVNAALFAQGQEPIDWSQ